MCKIIKNYVVVALFVLELVMSFAISIPLENNQSANDNSISNCPRIISRSEWKARKARSTEALDHTPAPYVIVHHGGIKRYCSDEKTCADIVRSYQNLHLDKNGWFDIGYQFVIGEDGNIYEGRGWDLVGAHAPGYNTQSIGICIIGDFTETPTIITRKEWGAKKSNGNVDALTVNPATYVVIHHAATDICTTRAICQARVRVIQDYHINTKKWSDIGYNFLVGEDGNVYEGRGWGKMGAHTKGYNEKSIGICIIGNYENRAPNNAAIEAVKNLISHGVSLGKISNTYSLIGHRQVGNTSCPGDKLYQSLQNWSQWAKKT